MLVCLQKRSPANSLGTSSASCLQAFTVKMVPVRAFSGCAPRGLMDRPSLKVPVHSYEIWIWVKILGDRNITSSFGSFFASSWLSL